MSTTIEQLNRDFDAFYEFCKENNLSDDDIKNICQPLLKTVRKARLIKHLKICIFTMFLLLTIYTICCTETASWHLSAIGRIALIKILPFYDWTHLQNAQCLIAKSTMQKIKVPNCVLCETIDDIATINEFDSNAIYDNYIQLHIPFTVTAATSWNILSQNIANLTELLIKNEILADTFPCKLSSNLYNNDEPNFKNILKKTAHFQRYFIHFQNCEWEAVKQFRIFAPRPEFLNRKIAPIQYSWLLLNRNYNVRRFKRIALRENVAVVVQVLGNTIFRLTPQSECGDECGALEIELKENEGMVVTSLWDLEYKPVAFGENVAVILETH